MPSDRPIGSLFPRLFQKVADSIIVGESIFIDDNLSGNYTLLDYVYEGAQKLSFPNILRFTTTVICLEGSMTATINGRIFQTGKDDLLLVKNGSIVESLTCSADLKTIAMAFADVNEGELMGRQIVDARSFLVHRSIPVRLHLETQLRESYVRLYQEVKVLYEMAQGSYKKALISHFLCMSSDLFLSMLDAAGKDEEHHSREQEIYLKFMDDLQVYASRERNVSFYADRCCVSPKHFSKMVRLASGKVPVRLIKDRVIIEAKALLASTRMCVREIADTLHFQTDSFFCRYFRQETGMTPTEFREGISPNLQRHQPEIRRPR